MRKLALAVLPMLLLAFPEDADAARRHRGHHSGVRISVGVPGVGIHVGPWSVRYNPAPRPGYRWVDGHWSTGAWYPGHWMPVAGPPQPGWVWVVGHWEGGAYIEGYWRPPSRRGYVWVDGYYRGDTWVTGGWVPARTRGPAPPPVAEAPPPADAPLALPPDYDQPSERVRGETAARQSPEPPPEDSIWGDPIEEEALDEEPAPEGGVHHSLDW